MEKYYVPEHEETAEQRKQRRDLRYEVENQENVVEHRDEITLRERGS